MAGRRINNTGGCGTIFIILLIIGFLSEALEWMKSNISIVIGILVFLVFIYASHKWAKNKQMQNVIVDKKQKTGRIMNDKLQDGIIIYSGRYVAQRDISSGIYDVILLEGSGSIRTDVPEKVWEFLNKDNTMYNNLEISKDTVLKIDTGLTIELYNKRDYIEQKYIETNLEEGATASYNDNYIDSMDGWQFEYFCADVLRKNGYQNVDVTKGSGDQGVDIIAERDGIRYAIQCKRYSQSVGNKAVQEIYAGKKFYHCHVGIIMTNNYFTASAKELASEDGIILWDRDFLKKFICKNDYSIILGYKNTNQSVKDNADKEDRRVSPVVTPSGTQKMVVTNESGLYSLIFGSKLESAKKFKKWVTSEVLPQLRKTGSYGTPQVPVTTAEQIKLLAQGHTELKEEIDAVKSDVDELKKELPLFPYEADLIMNAARKKGVSVLGGKQSKAYRNRSIVHKVYRNLYLSLNIQFDVRTYKAIKRRYLEQAIESVEKLEPPIVLRDEILMENAQIKYDTK